jgi:hypothetical protein
LRVSFLDEDPSILDRSRGVRSPRRDRQRASAGGESPGALSEADLELAANEPHPLFVIVSVLDLKMPEKRGPIGTNPFCLSMFTKFRFSS